MRKTYIDNLRSFVSILVVVYHVIWVFNGIQEFTAAGSVTRFHGQDAVLYLLYPWFMVIFFIMSGMSAGFYLEKHSVKDFICARTTKLLVPSTIGVLLFGWIQGFINMKLGGFFESAAEPVPKLVLFFIMDFSGTGVLWTMQMLWLFSVLLVFVRAIEKGRVLMSGKKANLAVLLLFGVFAWGFAQVLNMPVVVVYRFGIYAFAFFCGYFVFSHDEVIARLERSALLLGVAALGLGIIYVISSFGSDYTIEPSVNSPLAISFGWVCCLALLGLFKRFFDVETAFTRFLSKRSFGLYLFHYLGLSGAALLLREFTAVSGFWIYLICGFSAFAVGFGLTEIVPEIPFLRWVLMGVKHKN